MSSSPTVLLRLVNYSTSIHVQHKLPPVRPALACHTRYPIDPIARSHLGKPLSDATSARRDSPAGLLGDALVVTYNLGDDELEELLGELGIESRFDGELAKALDLLLLAARVGWRQSLGGLELPHGARDPEPLCEQVDEG